MLVTGWGDSRLGHEMHQDGYKKVINIDFEQDVIDKMDKEFGKIGEEEYLKMDVLDMNQIDEKTIDLVIDKGTLDALFSSNQEEDHTKIEKYFNEILRVLKPNTGYFVCVSLLQLHIFKQILSFFIKNENSSNSYYENSIIETKITEIPTRWQAPIAERKIDNHRVVFLVSVKRTEHAPGNATIENFKSNFYKSISFNDSLIPCEDVKNEILKTQMLNLKHGNLKELYKGRIVELKFELDPTLTKSELPKFKLVLLDNSSLDIWLENTCAVFIVPQGKELEPMYSSDEGYKLLSSQLKYSRVILVCLNSGNNFVNFETVKKELEPTIVKFAQLGYTNEIPYITLSEGIGQRNMIGNKYKVEQLTLETMKGNFTIKFCLI